MHIKPSGAQTKLNFLAELTSQLTAWFQCRSLTKPHIIFKKFLKNLSPDKHHNLKFSWLFCLSHTVARTRPWGLSGPPTAGFMLWGRVYAAEHLPDGHGVASGTWRARNSHCGAIVAEKTWKYFELLCNHFLESERPWEKLKCLKLQLILEWKKPCKLEWELYISETPACENVSKLWYSLRQQTSPLSSFAFKMTIWYIIQRQQHYWGTVVLYSLPGFQRRWTHLGCYWFQIKQSICSLLTIIIVLLPSFQCYLIT